MKYTLFISPLNNLFWILVLLIFNPGGSCRAQPGNTNFPTMAFQTEQQTQAGPKRIQIVFCLDVTGSMGGLIATAKQKIWSITSSLLQAEPRPDIELGMVFYRDRGDRFVTRLIPFTRDMDSLYADLMEMNADGGGDSPESVNQALNEAVTKFQWIRDTSIYKVIFLVGDCPPHMDYKDDVKYPETCRLAAKSGIVINTLQMGNCYGAAPVWQSIASFSGGDYLAVDQNANGYVVTTPYDTIISRLQNVVDNTVVYYGSYEQRRSKEVMKDNANKIYKNGKSNEAASRAEYKKSKGLYEDVYYQKDLVKEFHSGRVILDTIRAENLPDNMKRMTCEERVIYLKTVSTTRDTTVKNLNRYIEKRNQYIKDQSMKETDKSSASFSSKVYESMKKQSAKKGVVLKGTVKE